MIQVKRRIPANKCVVCGNFNKLPDREYCRRCEKWYVEIKIEESKVPQEREICFRRDNLSHLPTQVIRQASKYRYSHQEKKHKHHD